MNVTAYPLQWPAGWERTPRARIHWSRFEKPSMEKAASEVFKQLRMMGVGNWNIIISTNIKVRADGIPYSAQKQPDDKGVAVYFKRKNKDVVFAADGYDRVEDNVWAIAKSLEALRAIERYGVAQVMDRAFSGFAALPEKASSRLWYDVLGIDGHASTEAVLAKYKQLAKLLHPDQNGGASEGFHELQTAMDQFKKIRGIA
jgi:hypothetical protein